MSIDKKFKSISKNNLIIGIVAIEKSADILGSGLIRFMKLKFSNISFIGVAGSLMLKEGCKTWYKSEECSAIGIIEIFWKIPKLLRVRSDLVNRFIRLKPDIFIGIDSPDFNIFLEKKLKKNGIKTVHYVSPSIWAWRENRIFEIKKAVDLMLVIFPFEKKIYDRFNIPCCFIGHSTADNIPLIPNKIAAQKQLNLEKGYQYLSVLPGSRYAEVKMLTPIFLRTLQIIKQDFPNLKILLPIAHENLLDLFKTIFHKMSSKLSLEIVNGNSKTVMMASDVALLASGTATLECMLAKCPMVVGYKINPITYFIIKKMIKVNFISIPNLLANRELVKEFIQSSCKPDLLSSAIKFLLVNKKYVVQLKKNFLFLHREIRCNADEKASNAILKLNNSDKFS